SSGGRSSPLDANAKAAVGNIKGIKLSIPQNYLLSGVHYRGDEVWKRSQAPPPVRTFDSEIQDFSLLLRESNLQPVRNEQDRADYLEYGRTANPRPDNRWLTTEFLPDWFVVNEGKLQAVFDRYMKDEAKWGPFIPQDKNVYGMKHAVSTQQEKDKQGI